ncbi:hypothetical protein PSJ60_23315 [Escherichia coli]|uniref:hypothetical protein n=1 Tax=Escherichia coli TaxID=562 RepID=UPI002359E27D|nr:hypothetical protein [Escherichia coli]MDC9067761.1 hypothetical protein [Escherichia coli]
MKLFYSKPVRFIVIICVFLLGVDNLSDMFVDISRPVFYGGLAALPAAAVVIARVDYNKNAEKKGQRVQ